MKKLSNLKASAILILSLYSGFCWSQYSEVIRSARPGQMIGSATVGAKVLQFQQGLDYNSFYDTTHPDHDNVLNNVIRFGINENLELSSVINYKVAETNRNIQSFNAKGFSNISFGFRLNVSNQNKWIPSTAFQMRMKLPNTSDDFGTDNLGTTMILATGWSLSEKTSLGTNWILEYDGNTPDPTGRYVINFGYQINDKWSTFIENYGSVKGKVFQTRFDTGLAYLINNNVQLDIYGGFGNNKEVKDYFISGGISWRIVSWRD